MRPRAVLPRWLSSPPPTVGLEFAPRRVTAVSVARARGGAVVAAHATESLPAGALVPALNAHNVADRAAVEAAVSRVLAAVGRPHRVGVVLPDSVAKVSLVRFDQAPAKASDLDALIRWQVRKAVPFPLERAQLTWTDGVTLPEGGREAVVALMRRDIVEEYEAVCAAAGAHAGLVDLASFNLVNLALLSDLGPVLSGAGDWLLVHVTSDYSTLAIVRGDRLVLYRNRLADAEGHLADLVHQTAMYYEDRLGGTGFSRVLVAGREEDLAGAGDLRTALEGRLRSPVEPLDLRRTAALADRIDAPADLLAALSAPVGLVLREA
jgi:type IV pilus assembly protein PilM